MGYSAYLGKDYIGQAGTVSGWGDFSKAVDALPTKGNESLIHLAERGWTKDLDGLEKQLSAIKDPVAADLLASIRTARKPEHSILVVSDDTNDGGNQSGDAPLADGPEAPDDSETVIAHSESDPSLSDVVTRIKDRLDNILNHAKK